MKREWVLVLVAVAVFVLSLIVLTVRREKTYRVPRLHGEDVYLKESELDKVTPLGWAMMLDMNEDEDTLKAYERQCQKNPKLAAEVDRLFDIKGMIDAAKRRTEARRRLFR